MGKIDLDKRIMGQMETWGGNYNSTEGDNHCSEADKISKEIDSKEITLNVMAKMDASHAKPDSMNPGFDKAFWAKAQPQMDTTGHGKLTRAVKDDMKHDTM